MGGRYRSLTDLRSMNAAWVVFQSLNAAGVMCIQTVYESVNSHAAPTELNNFMVFVL